jgi:phage-related minor tail protein
MATLSTADKAAIIGHAERGDLRALGQALRNAAIGSDAAATVAALTDSSGGSPDGTLEAVSGTSDDGAINNNFAELNAKIDELRAALAAFGITTS